MSLPALTNSLVVSVYGTNASDAVSYGLGQVSTGTVITATEWNLLATKVNAERTRRGAGTISISVSSPINHTTFNTMASGIAVAGPASSQAYNTSGTTTVTTYPQATAISTTTATNTGTLIYATNVNALINDINNSGAVCTCNCNYCTCNCNYCTCNCNYSCTCNCNYSDIRLKTDIELIGTEFGLNIYSFKYLADLTKRFVGVMAQELVGTTYEHALTKDANGYYMVDYSLLPVKMIEG